ncbi:sigma-70 family RNA polymerase sigma factor [Nocardioides hankookensis]
MGVILIDEHRGATRRMTRSGGPRADDDRSGDARPGVVWAEATDGFNRWVAGEAAGLDDLVAVMTPVLWHVVRAYRLPESAAEDVIQNTWLALVRRRAAILDPVAVGGWLTTTARREAWRSAGAKTTPTPVEDEDLALALPRQRSAEESVVQHDEGDRLWAAVDGLPERCRRLLRIVAFENRPDYRELATELGMPVGSIGPTRGRCLAKLRVALIEAGGI